MKKLTTKRLTILSLFFAIILVQEFVPLIGNIPIGPFSLTLIDMTVLTASLTLGSIDGAIIGGFWGVVTFIRAFTIPSSPVAPLVFTNPLISILPKIIMGGLCAWIFIRLRSKLKTQLRMIVAIVITEIVTGIFTLGPIYLFYATPNVSLAFGAKTVAAFGYVIMTVIFTNAIPETIMAAIIVPLIVNRVRKGQLAGESIE